MKETHNFNIYEEETLQGSSTMKFSARSSVASRSAEGVGSSHRREVDSLRDFSTDDQGAPDLAAFVTDLLEQMVSLVGTCTK